MDSINENPQKVPKTPVDIPMTTLTAEDVQRMLEASQAALLEKVQKLIDASLVGYVRETKVTSLVQTTIDERLEGIEKILSKLTTQVEIIGKTIDPTLKAIADDATEAKETAQEARDIAQQAREDGKEARHEIHEIRDDIFGEEHRPGIMQIISKGMADLITADETRHTELKAIVEQTHGQILELYSDLKNQQNAFDERLKRIEPFINGVTKISQLVKRGVKVGIQTAGEHPGIVKGIMTILAAIITALIYGDISTP